MGVKNHETDPRTKKESWRRLGGLQEENVQGDEGQMEKDEIANDGREKNAEKTSKTSLGQ